MTVFPILSLTHWLQRGFTCLMLIWKNFPTEFMGVSREVNFLTTQNLLCGAKKAWYMVRLAQAVLVTASIGHEFEDMQKGTNP
jgi:hypothetical protein